MNSTLKITRTLDISFLVRGKLKSNQTKLTLHIKILIHVDFSIFKRAEGLNEDFSNYITRQMEDFAVMSSKKNIENRTT